MEIKKLRTETSTGRTYCRICNETIQESGKPSLKLMEEHECKQHPQAWKWFRAYANIPIPLRSTEIFAVVNNEPLTAQVIQQEVDHKTEIGFKAIEQLIRMKVI